MSTWSVVPRNRQRVGQGLDIVHLYPKNGQVYLGRPLLTALGEPEWVELLTNGQPRTFAVRPVATKTADARHVTRSSTCYGVVTARAIIKRLCATGDRMVRAEARIEDGLLVITVPDPAAGAPA